jgi:O-antigen ligase
MSAGAPRTAALAFAAFLALFAVSFAAGLLRGRDPYDALPLLPALVLFAWGASRAGEAASERALGLLVACGAATGLLAALQRFAGLFRLPVESPEPRFLATALIGNPGDVGASLVIPTLLAAAALFRGRGRLAPGLALLAGLAGLAAASTFAPLAAFAAGAAILVALEPGRRLLPAAAVAAVGVALLAGAGVFARVAAKLDSGDLSTVTTQRDIGVLSALESIRARPLAGTGPGGFASDFVRARLAAEERWGRRLVHRSPSAHFDNAHCDPLTVAAEAGVPAALALAVALGALLAGLAGAVRRERGEPPAAVPAEALLASLAAILVLALANFPVQIVPVSGPFALLAGLAFARAGGGFSRRPGAVTRAGLAALVLLLAAGGAARLAASRRLARSEAALASAAVSSGSGRAALLDAALADARSAAALRPRSARAHLDAGSALAARADLDGAITEMERSRSLEERAETLLNLGRLAVTAGRLDEARAFFLRAAWVQPRLVEAIPPAGDPDGVHAAVGAIEASLATGARTPPPPPPLRPR